MSMRIFRCQLALQMRSLMNFDLGKRKLNKSFDIEYHQLLVLTFHGQLADAQIPLNDFWSFSASQQEILIEKEFLRNPFVEIIFSEPDS